MKIKTEEDVGRRSGHDTPMTALNSTSVIMIHNSATNNLVLLQKWIPRLLVCLILVDCTTQSTRITSADPTAISIIPLNIKCDGV